jgi:hypothetical protein
MSMEELKKLDPEILLQELRRRESERTKETERTRGVPSGALPLSKLLPFGRPPAGLDQDKEQEQLEKYDTKDLLSALRGQQKVIYGTDDREDMYEVTDARVLVDADSVAALIRTSNISDNGDGTSTLNGPTFGQARNLCQTEPFRTQPTIAFCSGFLVDPSIIATAAHCIEQSDLNAVKFVFGFEMTDATTARTRVSNDEIYTGIRILGRQIGTAGTDWALVQIDRPVLNHRYVRIRHSGKVSDNAAVHVIGHPSGIPKKYAGGANVRDNTPARYFVANLDTYGGNSGSAVFNASTHEVEGVLVRGETDFVQNGNCMVSNICPGNGCRGEDCTRTTEFASLVPRHVHDCIPFDPAQAQVAQAGGRWKITVGGMWLLDFGSKRNEAEQAFKVIKHYGMNSQCFVGRPAPSMEYYLVNGQAPEGRMAGEDCIGFNPSNIEVQHVRGRWKIVEGSHWIMDFDQQEDEARQALSYILRYGFRYICFVGRPDPSMTYFRK